MFTECWNWAGAMSCQLQQKTERALLGTPVPALHVDVTSQKPHQNQKWSKCPPCRAPKLFPPPFYEVLGPSPELYSTQHYALPEKNKHKSVGKQWHKCAQCAKHSGIFIDIILSYSSLATPKRSLGKGLGHEWIM